MTDKEKLEKLVAYLERRMYAHNQMADIGSTGEIFDEKIENAKYEECRDTLNFIDSLQKEPKKCMYSKDNYTDEDRKVLCEDCKEKCEYNKKEEPVSEDLEEAVHEYMQHIPESEPELMDSFYTWEQMEAAFKAGAKWQFNQFEKNRLAACDRATDEEIKREQNFVDKIIIGEHRQPTYSDAIEYGIKWQKEIDDNAKRQIHKNAVEYGKSQMLNAACEYLIAHSLLAKPIIDDFRKALEED